MQTGKKLLLAGAVSILVAGGSAYAYAKTFMPFGGMHGDAHFCEMNGPLGGHMVERLERAIKPTDAQKPELDALKAALTKAQDTMKASCPKEGDAVDLSPPGRLATMEKHLSTMLEAVKTIRPAADALYAKLDDKQRDALRWAMPLGMAEHHRHHGDHMMNGQSDDNKTEQ